MAPSRITRHHAPNDIISRAFASAKISVTKETSGLFRNDGKRPDGLTLIPWQRGLSLKITWDITVATTLADLYISASASAAGAQLRWRRPEKKPNALSGSYVFQVWKLWAQSANESAVQFS